MSLLSLLLSSSPVIAADWPGPADVAPWTELPTGVEVQDLEVGSGTVVVEGSIAEVRYTGMLSDGSVFDTNMDGGQTLSFRVGARQVIAGWEDGLIGMKVGGRRRLFIPSDQGYGARAVGPIPPDSALYFEVVLLGVKAPRGAPDAPQVVPEDAFRVVGDTIIRYADLTVGTGARAKKGQRVCLDWASFRDGALVESTWKRERCTWVRLGEQLLPEALEAGLVRMRSGSVRQIVDGAGVIYEVTLEATGK